MMVHTEVMSEVTVGAATLLVAFTVTVLVLFYEWVRAVAEYVKHRGRVPRDQVGHILIGLVYAMTLMTGAVWFWGHPPSTGYAEHIALHLVKEGLMWTLMTGAMTNALLAWHIKIVPRKCGDTKDNSNKEIVNDETTRRKR